jgi:preprotein translocase subunit SecF
MELFKDTCFDFLGRKWWFILPSLILSLAGLASLIVKGGPLYSVDFRGGALMAVNWGSAPPIERIRAVVSSRLGETTVVASHDLSGADEILISTPVPNEGDLVPILFT